MTIKIEDAFMLGLEFSNLTREEMKLVKQARQSNVIRMNTIQSRKNEILNIIYEERIKTIIE